MHGRKNVGLVSEAADHDLARPSVCLLSARTKGAENSEGERMADLNKHMIARVPKLTQPQGVFILNADKKMPNTMQ